MYGLSGGTSRGFSCLTSWCWVSDWALASSSLPQAWPRWSTHILLLLGFLYPKGGTWKGVGIEKSLMLSHLLTFSQSPLTYPGHTKCGHAGFTVDLLLRLFHSSLVPSSMLKPKEQMIYQFSGSAISNRLSSVLDLYMGWGKAAWALPTLWEDRRTNHTILSSWGWNSFHCIQSTFP